MAVPVLSTHIDCPSTSSPHARGFQAMSMLQGNRALPGQCSVDLPMQAGKLVDKPLVAASCGTSHLPINPGRHAACEFRHSNYQLGQKPSQTCANTQCLERPRDPRPSSSKQSDARKTMQAPEMSASQRQQMPLPTQPHQPITKQQIFKCPCQQDHTNPSPSNQGTM
jgi:hypothetical protein